LKHWPSASDFYPFYIEAVFAAVSALACRHFPGAACAQSSRPAFLLPGIRVSIQVTISSGHIDNFCAALTHHPGAITHRRGSCH